MGTLALRLTGGVKDYGGRPVLDGLDLEVSLGDRLAVLGPSGSGKSTLLRVLADLEPLDAGSVEHGATCATVFQQPLLLPWLDVEANIRLGGRFKANRGRYGDARATELTELFGLADLARSRPAQLSGGQAQRVAIARAMAVDADVLLLDEPFSALDPATRRDLQTWLRDTADRLGLTLVLVTHDVDEALYLGTTIVALDGAGGVGARWANPEPGEHDAAHPLRAELVAGYRSQLAGAP